MHPLLPAITPPAMQERLMALCDERADFRILSWLLHERMLAWMHSVGVCEDTELQTYVPPFPPEELRQITNAGELPVFLYNGIVDTEMVLALYEEYKPANAPAIPAILDFGCGCGRLNRYLGEHPHYRTFGCDVNPDLVEWCQKNL